MKVVSLYVCEICDGYYRTEEASKRCIESHGQKKCEHKSASYRGFNHLGENCIRKICDHCNQVLEDVALYVPTAATQKNLFKMFHTLLRFAEGYDI